MTDTDVQVWLREACLYNMANPASSRKSEKQQWMWHGVSGYHHLMQRNHPLPVDDPRFVRKLRSERLLAKHGVTVLPWMPVATSADEAVIRPVAQVVDRVICLVAVALKAEGLRDGNWPDIRDHVETMLDEYAARGSMTPREEAFFSDEDAKSRLRVAFDASCESVWTLLWALEFVEELAWPDKPCDEMVLKQLVSAFGPQGLRTAARLRPVDELLDEADSVQRLYWVVQNGRTPVKDRVPAVLADVVDERHRSLAWLTGQVDFDA